MSFYQTFKSNAQFEYIKSAIKNFSTKQVDEELLSQIQNLPLTHLQTILIDLINNSESMQVQANNWRLHFLDLAFEKKRASKEKSKEESKKSMTSYDYVHSLLEDPYKTLNDKGVRFLSERLIKLNPAKPLPMVGVRQIFSHLGAEKSSSYGIKIEKTYQFLCQMIASNSIDQKMVLVDSTCQTVLLAYFKKKFTNETSSLTTFLNNPLCQLTDLKSMYSLLLETHVIPQLLHRPYASLHLPYNKNGLDDYPIDKICTLIKEYKKTFQLKDLVSEFAQNTTLSHTLVLLAFNLAPLTQTSDIHSQLPLIVKNYHLGGKGPHVFSHVNTAKIERSAKSAYSQVVRAFHLNRDQADHLLAYCLELRRAQVTINLSNIDMLVDKMNLFLVIDLNRSNTSERSKFKI